MNINEKDYVVINDSSRISGAKVRSVDEFLEEASREMVIDGDLYCYIPDFSSKLYNIVKNSVEDSIWFAFNEKEIPSWFNSSEAVILNNLENDEDDFESTSEGDILDKEFDSNNDEDLVDESDSNDTDDVFMSGIQNLLESDQTMKDDEEGGHEARVYVYGSSKGGTGKTFTCLISAYHYAKTHPSEKIAVADFDIIDGQVGISINIVRPTMMDFWRLWVNGNDSFKNMYNNSCKSPHFPQNVDFYLAPKDYYINDTNFWVDSLQNLLTNYDVVFFDTGIDYINYEPISYAYKIADRIVLVSTTSIKSVSSVLKQINKLTGVQTSANANGVEVYSKEDDLGPKLRLAITGFNNKERQNKIVIGSFNKVIKINAIFGQLSETISKCEYFGEWDIFDNNQKFNESLDKLMDMSE